MAAYIIVEVNVTDQALYDDYKNSVVACLTMKRQRHDCSVHATGAKRSINCSHLSTSSSSHFIWSLHVRTLAVGK